MVPFGTVDVIDVPPYVGSSALGVSDMFNDLDMPTEMSSFPLTVSPKTPCPPSFYPRPASWVDGYISKKQGSALRKVMGETRCPLEYLNFNEARAPSSLKLLKRASPNQPD